MEEVAEPELAEEGGLEEREGAADEEGGLQRGGPGGHEGEGYGREDVEHGRFDGGIHSG